MWSNPLISWCILYILTWLDIVQKRAVHVGLVCHSNLPCSEWVPNLASPWLLQWPPGQSAAKHPVYRSLLACGRPPHRLTVQEDLLKCAANLETRDIPWSTAVLVVMVRDAEQPEGRRIDTRGRIPGGEQTKQVRGSAGNGWRWSSKPLLPSAPPFFPHCSPLFYLCSLWCESGWLCPTNARLNHCTSEGGSVSHHRLRPSLGRLQLLLPSCPPDFLYPYPHHLPPAKLQGANFPGLMEAHGLTSAGEIGSVTEDRSK